jgi:phosphate transport system protein
MHCATDALLYVDLSLAEDAIDHRGQLTRQCAQLQSDWLASLAKQSPAIGDLRARLTILKDIAALECMAAVVGHVAHITRLRYPGSVVPARLNSYFSDMGRMIFQITIKTKDVVLYGDSDGAARIYSEAMGDIRRHLVTVADDSARTYDAATVADITLISRYYERFAHQAIDIANRGQARFPGQL